MAFTVEKEAAAPIKKIMIFLEGTIFYTKPILFLFTVKGYVPIGKCVNIINSWNEQGAEIIFCTYAKKNKVNFIKRILKEYGLNYHRLCYRDKKEQYKDIVEQIKPDILIEDDCKSIGGASQMCITNVNPDLKKSIKSIVIKEYTGIDMLSRNLEDL